MLLESLVLALPLVLLSAVAKAAEASLFIPAADPFALAVQNVGTDAEGHTTWALAAGVASDTLETPPYAFSATMVAGPTDIHLVENVPDIPDAFALEDCAVASALAACTILYSASGSVTTAGFTTVTVSSFPVQLVTTLAPLSGSNTGATSAPTAGTSSSTASPTSRGTDGAGNGGLRTAKVSMVLAVGVALVGGFLGNTGLL
ncbi:uncharacterized protein BXZ73DRAFT_105923 [Epithele typhae]|uniref:uncharacterized protein n=1 Tax=Epithele typhae TaxID=378194 RepID=UPI00200750CC|nr:uncharacterized protein BXZ73DRAFT_105923 [Epithele typhae]KAH9916296.1 hypothetical protein BXZ73DRAFT_105923 [Epithele typhae]